MITLFLDTSSSFLCIAVFKDNVLVKEVYEKLDTFLSKLALVKVKELLDSLKIQSNEVDEIICVNGPGSYTGLRVGVTIAKTYAWGLNKKLIPASSLFVMATSIKNRDYIVPIIDARRNCVFAAIFDNNYNIVMNEKYIAMEELLTEVNKLNGNYSFVSVDDFNNISVERYKPNLDNFIDNFKKVEADIHSFVPNYLKKTEAEEHLND